MKLQSKILIVTNSKGQEIFPGKNIALDLNGERIDIKLKDIGSHLEFDMGEIYGNFLLSYYTVNQDGSLQVEGSKVQLFDAATNEPILVKEITKPGIHDDEDIPFEHVQKFVEFFKIAKPEEVFFNLTDAQKQEFISAREAAAAPPAIEEAPEAKENEIAAQKKVNAELKAQIHPNYVQEKKNYISTQGFYAGIGAKEYIKEKYHLFYGPDASYEPCVLIKHGEWWEEIKEENTEIADKTDKTVVIEFSGINETGKITLDIETSDIKIEVAGGTITPQ